MLDLKRFWSSFVYLSGFLVLISLTSFFIKPVNLGVEFSGGVNISIKNSNFDIKKIKEDLRSRFGYNVHFDKIEEDISNLRVKLGKNQTESVENMRAVLEKYLNDKNIKIISTESIGSSMDLDMILSIIYSVLIALAFIFFYILFRFNYKFAISAILTLVMNVILSIAFINIINFEINLILITAILTIIGYCINDIIVIYDRIRRNADQQKDLTSILNEAIKQGKTRSILTSIATFFASISLFFIPDLKIINFATTFSFGIIFGTFASLFISTSFLVLLKADPKSLLEKPKDPMHFTS